MNGPWLISTNISSLEIGKDTLALETVMQYTVYSPSKKKDGVFQTKKSGAFKQAKCSIKHQDPQEAYFTDACGSFGIDFSGNRNST